MSVAKKFRQKLPVWHTWFAWAGLAVLLATTVFWTVLAAKVHLGNADQLVDPYMFENATTFAGALFPGQHSLLVKWPLFWLVKLGGFTDAAFLGVTLLMTLGTVGGLAYVIHRIVRAPFVFGVLCLAMACVLLATPTQPYAGAILPVNMAMLTTRNLEYVLYIGALALLTQLTRVTLRAWRFWLATGILALLVASDKLFLAMSLGGALLALAVCAVARRREWLVYAGNWLLASGLGAAGAYGLVWLLDASTTHIVNGAGAGPYGWVANWHDVALAVIYAGMGLLTNMGANPAFDAVQVNQIPARALAHLLTPGGLVLAANAVVAGLSMVALVQLIRKRFARKQAKAVAVDRATQLAFSLVATTVVAVAVFVTSNHYYPVDARYLSIGFFAAMVVLAVYARDQRWISKRKLSLVGCLAIAVCAGLVFAAQNYKAEMQVAAPMTDRNKLVAAAMTQHSASLLLGDYWRVFPAKQLAGNTFQVMPLASCADPRPVLSSTAWQPSLSGRSFAYLLSLDSHSPDFPACGLGEVLTKFGLPSASVAIAGTVDHPQELLLFYDHGARRTKHSSLPATVLPISLDQLPKPTCRGKTIFTTIAHQDDDLLFMNPDHQRALQTGDCLRTVYLTAGDAGEDQLYWLGREKGSQEAYDLMDGPGKDAWIQWTVRLGKQFVTIASPRNNPAVSLVFMRLPDGNPNGSGFAATRFESLEHLEDGRAAQMNSVDGQSVYSKQELTSTLVQLMAFYAPDEVHTQVPENLSEEYRDHSDHMAVGRLTQAAYQLNGSSIPVQYYVGYPIHGLPSNVEGEEFARKAEAFFTYSRFDGGGCTSLVMCSDHSVYGLYLERQYTHPF